MKNCPRFNWILSRARHDTRMA